MTDSILSSNNVRDLFIAIIFMAIIPCIAEEIFFRGIIQTKLLEILKNYHYAVWLAAFLFSFFHFQFYGFIPRMILGGILGYIFIWSNNICYSCIAHITNNIIAVLFSTFQNSQYAITYFGSLAEIFLLLSSTIISVFIIVRLKKIFYTDKSIPHT
ncbi:CPBP family intramembrane glutamic endopeptidase [Chondrinema litorale]|uniref:CPBP family intramembrane glutamic endopeptidase n=1 Tax=Chondrinema litorale TaxID=2994555 RepID=UPI002542D63D|nr:CPBP family intramembrane glutamic endopeptidase [Chondrinema litorale]UZR99999.1 CPBP family intramembrane metalloprotease [Chondrinema litorale]